MNETQHIIYERLFIYNTGATHQHIQHEHWQITYSQPIHDTEGVVQTPALVVLNKKVTTFGKKSNLKFGLIQTRQLH
jgi:hypothetical protein